jgi:hypothetical protein
MSIPSPVVLAYWDEAMRVTSGRPNFTLTEFSELRPYGVLRSWVGGTFASYATARDAEAPEEDGGQKRPPGPQRSRERAHAEDCTRGGARLRDSLHSARTLWVKRAKRPVKSSCNSPDGRV